MTPERWARLCELFDRCSPLTEQGREALWAETPNDPELIAEVRNLLEQHQESGEFLNEVPDLVKELRSPPKARFAPGDRLANRYHLLRLVGEGGMGQVFAAYDRELATEVAVKVLHADGASDYRRELQAGRRVTHPNVCRLFDLGRHQTGEIFLTMELVEGETLAGMLRRRGPLSIGEATPIVLQLVKGLSAIHEAGIAHRDLTPANIMLSAPRAVIMDFGLAGRDAAPSGTPIGTWNYMAPEQLQGQAATMQSDIYSLALIIREMVSGTLPDNWRTALTTMLSHYPGARRLSLIPFERPAADERHSIRRRTVPQRWTGRPRHARSAR